MWQVEVAVWLPPQAPLPVCIVLPSHPGSASSLHCVRVGSIPRLCPKFGPGSTHILDQAPPLAWTRLHPQFAPGSTPSLDQAPPLVCIKLGSSPRLWSHSDQQHLISFHTTFTQYYQHSVSPCMYIQCAS